MMNAIPTNSEHEMETKNIFNSAANWKKAEQLLLGERESPWEATPGQEPNQHLLRRWELRKRIVRWELRKQIARWNSKE